MNKPKYQEIRKYFFNHELDRDRYIRQYHYTLGVLTDFSSLLGEKKFHDIDEVLKELSPGILEATLSDLIVITTEDYSIKEAFIPIEEGVQPYEINSQDKKIPKVDAHRKKQLQKDNFVIFKLNSNDTLFKLGFRYILISHFKDGLKNRVIGLCRTENQYLSEDGRFIASVLNLLQESVRIGKAHHKDNAFHNYINALTGGSWQELISSVKNFIRANDDSDDINIDLAWEDLIDALRYMANIGSKNITRDNFFYEKFGDELYFNKVDGLFEFVENDDIKSEVQFKDNALTCMAILRLVIAGRFGKGSENLNKIKLLNKVSSIPSFNETPPANEELNQIGEILSFITLVFNEFIKPSSKNNIYKSRGLCSRLELSYLRTLWLYLFYLSLETLRTPADYLISV